jgi:DNA-binding NtrC family response regulator
MTALPLTVNPTVLVVDDEQRLRDMLMRHTSEIGYKAVGARSAEQGWKILERESIEIVLLDLNLPGIDGMRLLEQIQTLEHKPQVIILTGFGGLEAARQAIRLDVVDFLTKPCPLGELEIALDRARRRLQPVPVNPISDSPQITPQPAPQVPPNATLDELERTHILAALDRHNGNRAAVAAELGISERTLYYRLAQYARG